MAKNILKKALMLGMILSMSYSVLAYAGYDSYYGNYDETNSSYDYHKACQDHTAYVSGTDVLLRRGPSKSYDVEGVTQKRMHVFIVSLVGENFEPFRGVVTKNNRTFKNANPVNLRVGDQITIKRINVGHSMYAVADINGSSHALLRNEVDIVFDKPIWYEVYSEIGHGYIYGQFLNRLSEFPNSKGCIYHYYDRKYDISEN